MSTDRQKSFIGTLTCNGKPIEILTYSPPHEPLRDYVGSHKLGQGKHPFYFRYEGDHYVIYARAEHSFIGTLVTEAQDRTLVIGEADDDGDFKFQLKQHGQTVTLDSMNSNSQTIRLSVSNGSWVRIKNAQHVDTSVFPFVGKWVYPDNLLFTTTDDGVPIAEFELTILERNVPYLSHPDEV